ncbi:MAG TPA: PQQ-binding-like beta-propeller repeat protein, partial [Pirellulaceae bacterium]|nr:PQQ-binding-like beta-propeller repeat protein [Pirellulaceae bacterium]
GQGPPISWDAGRGKHLLWKVELPGLGNSCPVIWQDRLFVTTATSDNANRDVRIGLYGNVDSVEDDSEYEFAVICLNKHTGELVWRRTVHTGRPAVKRHSKSSHANPTVATDGKFVISFFGSEGLYCHDFDGNLVWQKHLGFLDSGWFLDPGYQWGFGSSPTIFEDRVIVQCDIQQESFVAAFSLSTGEELWRTVRDEIPSWPSPVVHRFGDMPMLITHGTRAARGYDVRDGTLLWSVSGHSEIVVPTPFVAHNLIYLASGYAPVQPIVALRPEARGDIDLSAQTDANDGTRALASPLAWSTMRGGPYMPTPLVYGDFLYVCSNNGILTCYDALTGDPIYKERIKVGGTAASFTASLVAADGHVYAAAEDGRVAVIRAGRRYQLVSVNPCGESVLATPAISEGVFYLRTIHGLMAFAEPTEQSSVPGGTSRQ